jgi:hypothetical protein
MSRTARQESIDRTRLKNFGLSQEETEAVMVSEVAKQAWANDVWIADYLSEQPNCEELIEAAVSGQSA